MIRVELPHHLRVLAQVDREVTVDVTGAAGEASPTLRAVLDALESRYPVLAGTIREHGTLQRRPFLRFFACGKDISHQSPDERLPAAIAAGSEPLIVLGAIVGG